MVRISEFWKRVDKSRGLKACWLWTPKVKTRYGQFRWNGKTTGAHRLAYEFTYGSIPNGLSVLHHCDVPYCCNPAHLFLGTQTDNIRDRDMKGRQSRRKLSDKDVRAIRSLEGYHQGAIAAMFGVSRPHISKVLARRHHQRLA